MLTSGVAMMALAGALSLSACAGVGDQAQALFDRPQVASDVPESAARDLGETVDIETLRFVAEDDASGLRFYIGQQSDGDPCVIGYALDGIDFHATCSEAPVRVDTGGRFPDFQLIFGGPTPSAPEGFRAVGGGVFVEEQRGE